MDEADVCMLRWLPKRHYGPGSEYFSLATRKGKGIVILVNKWDMMEKPPIQPAIMKKAEKRIAPFSDVPIIFISAQEKLRIHKAIEVALQVYENKQRRVPTSELNEVMLKAIESYHPPVVRAILSVSVCNPITHPMYHRLRFFCNYPDDVKSTL